MITPQHLSEFKAILLQDYGVVVDDKTATKLANDFLTALEAIIKPQELTKTSERRKSDN